MQASQARLEAATREIVTANDAADKARVAAKNSSGEAAELRGSWLQRPASPQNDAHINLKFLSAKSEFSRSFQALGLNIRRRLTISEGQTALSSKIYIAIIVGG